MLKMDAEVKEGTSDKNTKELNTVEDSLIEVCLQFTFSMICQKCFLGELIFNCSFLKVLLIRILSNFLKCSCYYDKLFPNKDQSKFKAENQLSHIKAQLGAQVHRWRCIPQF